MTPAGVRIREFSLPLRSPLVTAAGDLSTRHVTVVALEAESKDGASVRGVGEAAPLPPWTEGVEACRRALSDARESVDRGEDVHLDGLPPAARHAVSLAQADAAARREGVPLSETLAERAAVGGGTAGTVPVNATIGDGPVGATVAAAESAVTDGFDCLKLKVGARDLQADLDRLRAVRTAVGDDVALRADANGAWDPDDAERAVDALADLDFEYVEQPVPAADHDAAAALGGRGVAVALDEAVNRGTEWPEPIEAYADVVVLKPMAQGGPGATAALARHLRSRGVTPVVTTTVDGAVARTAAVHVAATIPDVPACGLATGDLLAEDVVDDPVPARDGRIEVPDGPGLAGDRFDDLV